MSAPCIKKYEGNPVLSTKNIPYEASLIFNAGVIKHEGQYIMVFRNDNGSVKEDWDLFVADKGDHPGRFKTNIGIAYSEDGKEWKVKDEPIFALASEGEDKIIRAYDPRLHVIEGKIYMCFAVDTFYGVRGGIATTEDFENWEILTMTAPDNRNMVLFPERVNGNFVRLERPFPVYGRGSNEAFDVWMSESPDMKFWGESRVVLGAEMVPFSNCKLGPAAPPIKTDKGWLTTFHAVYKHEGKELNTWEKTWSKEYYGGIMLLDLEDPSKVIGMYDKPLLSSDQDYELNGFRGSVIFPGGMVLEDDGEVKIYYGAADTVEALATANVDDLIALCLEGQ